MVFLPAGLLWMTVAAAQECVRAGRWRIDYDTQRGEAALFCDDSLRLGRMAASVRVHARDFPAAGRANVRKPADSCTLVVEHYTYKYLIRRIFTIDPVRDCVSLLLEVESGDGRIAVEAMRPMDGVVSGPPPDIRVESRPGEGWETALRQDAAGRVQAVCTPSGRVAAEGEKVCSPRIVIRARD